MYGSFYQQESSNGTAADVSVSYDGQPHSIAVNVTDPEDAAITYKKAGDAEYGAENPAFTDAGEYEAAYQVEKENYTTYTGTAKVTIAKAAQAAPAETFTVFKATGADKEDGSTGKCGKDRRSCKGRSAGKICRHR